MRLGNHSFLAFLHLPATPLPFVSVLVILLTCDIQFPPLFIFFTACYTFILPAPGKISLDFIAHCQLLFLHGMEAGLHIADIACHNC